MSPALRDRFFHTTASSSVVLIRVAVGAIFVSEGIQKFLFPAALGVGRFAKIGIPAPSFSAPFVGVVEIACGAAIVVGLLTRMAAVLLVIDMLVAIASTKVPMFREKGFWAMAHEARTDWAMLLAAAYLFLVGGGARSIDARWHARRR